MPLSDHNAAINLAVRDLAAARRFYEETLGLTPSDPSGPTLVAYRTGASTLLVYTSEFAGSNKATATTWSVGAELDSLVAALNAKGVTFEHYDNLPQLVREGDIHAVPNATHRIAWFKDPDGNILSLTNS